MISLAGTKLTALTKEIKNILILKVKYRKYLIERIN